VAILALRCHKAPTSQHRWQQQQQRQQPSVLAPASTSSSSSASTAVIAATSAAVAVPTCSFVMGESVLAQRDDSTSSSYGNKNRKTIIKKDSSVLIDSYVYINCFEAACTATAANATTCQMCSLPPPLCFCCCNACTVYKAAHV
jgi:hypothetical protein